MNYFNPCPNSLALASNIILQNLSWNPSQARTWAEPVFEVSDYDYPTSSLDACTYEGLL